MSDCLKCVHQNNCTKNYHGRRHCKWYSSTCEFCKNWGSLGTTHESGQCAFLFTYTSKDFWCKRFLDSETPRNVPKWSSYMHRYVCPNCHRCFCRTKEEVQFCPLCEAQIDWSLVPDPPKKNKEEDTDD